jgi:anti-anti-sigma factor
MATQSDFSLDYDEIENGELSVITATGELDLESAPQFERALERASRQGGALVVDLTGLRFMDSTGLKALLLSNEGFSAQRRRLAIAVADRSAVRHLFWVAGVEDRVSVFPTREQAVAFAEGGAA